LKSTLHSPSEQTPISNRYAIADHRLKAYPGVFAHGCAPAYDYARRDDAIAANAGVVGHMDMIVNLDMVGDHGGIDGAGTYGSESADLHMGPDAHASELGHTHIASLLVSIDAKTTTADDSIGANHATLADRCIAFQLGAGSHDSALAQGHTVADETEGLDLHARGDVDPALDRRQGRDTRVTRDLTNSLRTAAPAILLDEEQDAGDGESRVGVIEDRIVLGKPVGIESVLGEKDASPQSRQLLQDGVVHRSVQEVQCPVLPFSECGDGDDLVIAAVRNRRRRHHLANLPLFQTDR
jgi:hypothetical protein